FLRIAVQAKSRYFSYYRGIFKQLKTYVDDISKVISSSEDDTTSVIKKNNITSEHTKYANQAEILSWYYYAEGFEKEVKKILNNTRITINKTKSKVYKKLLTHLVDVDL
ncbi:17370_t:CDS:2, partial [Racocetra fulgida]